MIGVDANVLLRHILGDDPIWSERSSRFLEEFCSSQRPGYVNPVVLAEVAWVLRSRKGYRKDRLALVVESLLADENLIVGARRAVTAALEAFREGPAGFADCLVGELNAEARATPTYTIDKKALRRPPFATLP
jgi:predicted nucleic-acid-binding protein